MVAVVHSEDSKGLSREVRIADSASFDDGTYVLALDEKKTSIITFRVFKDTNFSFELAF